MKNKQMKMKVSSVSAGDGPSTSPAVKKMKQARLPFQIISSDAVKPLSAPPKKRKLSEEHQESPNKIGKTSKNIEETSQEKPAEQIIEPVVISDDEELKSDAADSSNDSPRTKVINPFVSLVDVALKRKLRKRSPPKKKAKKPRKAPKKSIEAASEKDEGNITNSVNNLDDKSEPINLDEDSKDAELVITKENKQTKSIETADHRIENKENIDEVEHIEELSSGDDAETSETNCKKAGSGETKCEEVKIAEKVCVESENNSNDIESENISDDNLEEEKNNITVNKQDDDEEKEDAEKNVSSEVDCLSNHGDGSSSECSKDEEENGDAKIKSPSRKRNIAPSNGEFATPKSRSKKEKSDSESSKEPSSSEKIPGLSPRTPTVDSKKLTPKQIQKRLDSVKKQQEREKERLEKEKKKQDEKDEKNRQRLEKEEQKKKEREEKEEQKKKEREEKERLKEQEKKEREEKEEAKRKDKEEKELQKKREKEAKEEERKKKEIEREEEKRKKEMEKEEQQSKKKKASAAFVNFFVPKDKSSTSRDCDDQHYQDVVKNDFLSNFTKKSDMRLAPIIRCHLNNDLKAALEEHITKQKVDRDGMYLSLLKNKDYEKGRYCPTWPLEEVNDDVIIVEDELPMDSLNSIVMDCPKQTLRAKMFSFSENRRPPYWGTWRRKSNLINGRKPFGVDSSILDYECDSDEEWEEEEPGESVGGSVAGGSDDEEGENDYDVDNEFMVPHGYLSEEEAMGEEDEQILSPEIQKAKLKILQCEFENEMKKNTERLHPRLLGILWQKSDGSKPDSCSDTVWNFLGNRKILCQEEQIFIQPTAANNYCEADDAKTSDKPKKSRKITEGMIPDLIRLVQGNTNSRGFLAHEFQIFISKSLGQSQSPEKEGEPKISPVPVSKMSIAKKIKDISKWMSCPEEGPMLGKMCWFITKEVREQFKVEMELPNEWSYALTPKRRSEVTKKEILKTPQQSKLNPEVVKSAAKEPIAEKKEGAFNITKFTKKLTQEERDKQFVNANPTPSVLNNGNDKEGAVPPTSAVPPAKKRVSLLFSGPIGKSLPTASKDAATTSDKEVISTLVKDSPNNDEAKKEDPPKDTTEVKVTEKKPASSKRKQEVTKKRVALISVPKGSDSPKIIKTNLLTQFIKTASESKKLADKIKSNKNNKETPMETDDCVVLSD